MSGNFSDAFKAKQFKKGETANPKGRPQMLPEMHLMETISKQEIKMLLTRMLRMPVAELKAMLNDETKPAHEMAIARLVGTALARGDEKRMEFIYNRLVGKVREEHNVTHSMKPFDEQVADFIEETEREALPVPIEPEEPITEDVTNEPEAGV